VTPATKAKTTPETISVREAADRLGVTTWQVYRWSRLPEGWPPAIHVGRTIRVSVPRLDAWLSGS